MHEGNIAHLVTTLISVLSKHDLDLLMQALEEGDGTIDILMTELVYETRKR